MPGDLDAWCSTGHTKTDSWVRWRRGCGACCMHSKEYNIEHNTGAIIADNNSAMDTACQIVEDMLAEENLLITWSVAENKLRSFGHIIAVVQIPFLKVKDNEAIVFAIEMIVEQNEWFVHFIKDIARLKSDNADRQTVLLMKKLYAFTTIPSPHATYSQSVDIYNGKILSRAGSTCWQSCLDMLLRAFQFRSAINHYNLCNHTNGDNVAREFIQSWWVYRANISIT